VASLSLFPSLRSFKADAFYLIVPRLNDRSQFPTLACTMHEELRQKWDLLALRLEAGSHAQRMAQSTDRTSSD
jgi:hypothetical protein